MARQAPADIAASGHCLCLSSADHSFKRQLLTPLLFLPLGTSRAANAHGQAPMQNVS